MTDFTVGNQNNLSNKSRDQDGCQLSLILKKEHFD